MEKKQPSKRILAAAALLTVLSAMYCNFAIHTEDWEIRTPRLPSEFDGLRITLLTDLHGARFGDDSGKLLAAVEASRPDLIAICGDLVDEASDRAMLDPLLTGLCALAPTYFVTGNHEWGREDTEDLLAQIASTGVTVLRNDWLLLEKNGQSLVLAGAEDRNAGAEPPDAFMERIRREVAEDPFVLMLYHRNNELARWAELETDVVLAGHGHGGVIRLPGIGGLLGTNRNFFPKDCEGVYTAGRTNLAVSRGLGGLRLWNRPHLPTVVLRSGS